MFVRKELKFMLACGHPGLALKGGGVILVMEHIMEFV
jgi:hypothetical protein